MDKLGVIDHTLLKNDVTYKDIERHCEEAVEMGTYSVCVNPVWVKGCASLLENDEVKVCTVIGFPLGANTKESKAFEAKNSVDNGADEIDMVINIGLAKSGCVEKILEEINMVKKSIGNTILKVIIETSEFNNNQKIVLYEIVARSDADYIKTSTGTTSKGATIEDVKKMVKVGRGRYKVKASGGVSDLATMKAMIDAGADRIGTSGGLRIMEELKGNDVSGVEVSNY